MRDIVQNQRLPYQVRCFQAPLENEDVLNLISNGEARNIVFKLAFDGKPFVRQLDVLFNYGKTVTTVVDDAYGAEMS